MLGYLDCETAALGAHSAHRTAYVFLATIANRRTFFDYVHWLESIVEHHTGGTIHNEITAILEGAALV